LVNLFQAPTGLQPVTAKAPVIIQVMLQGNFMAQAFWMKAAF
jgi:hypothetical protein